MTELSRLVSSFLSIAGSRCWRLGCCCGCGVVAIGPMGLGAIPGLRSTRFRGGTVDLEVVASGLGEPCLEFGLDPCVVPRGE